MSENKPNHICKNIYCNKGSDGGRKKYYACNSCDKNNNWKSVACSIECWLAYQNQVIEARSKGKSINLLPERTDMAETEVIELLNNSEETVSEEIKAEFTNNVDNNIKNNVTRSRKRKSTNE